ncbi:MAG TPA: helix-turn-helix domain-containing protein, partial [Acidimicrobiales bacterium]|nr:helix-turn-helix domain-containing protein [Acidimicrobiales bacterium]
YRLLYSLPLGERIEYVEHVLGPILRLPAVHKSTNLLGTLEAYFRCGGRRSTAANLLAIHENSLRYRLDRVQALLGRDLRSGPDRIHVEIALALTQIARQEMALDEEGGRSSRPEFRRSAVHVRRRRDGPGHHGAST